MGCGPSDANASALGGEDADTQAAEVAFCKDPSSVQMEHVYQSTFTLGEPEPTEGNRRIIPILQGTFSGPRLKGTFGAPSSDWARVCEDGSVFSDMRLVMKTDDGASMYANAHGCSNPQNEKLSLFITFEVGDARYKWLNHRLFTGRGIKKGNSITVDYFDVVHEATQQPDAEEAAAANPGQTGCWGPAAGLPSVKMEHVYSKKFNVGAPTPVMDGPSGHRFIFPIEGGKFSGPKLSGTFGAPAGDWALVRGDGSIALDIHIVMKMDDGVKIYGKAIGRSVREPDNPQNSTLTCGIRFEAGDDRYKWLNTKALTGRGIKRGNVIMLDYFDVIHE